MEYLRIFHLGYFSDFFEPSYVQQGSGRNESEKFKTVHLLTYDEDALFDNTISSYLGFLFDLAERPVL